MNNKIKIPVARLKQIIQEEVTRFYGLEDEGSSDEPSEEATLDGDEFGDLLEEEEMEEAMTPDQMKQREIGAATEKLNALPPAQAASAISKMGLR